MEPTKSQKNAGTISKLKQHREDLAKLKNDIESNHNSRKTSIVVSLLEEADHNLEDRMVELGMVKKLEASNEQ
jgi:hypothetical protein